MRSMSLTPDLVRLVTREVEDPGPQTPLQPLEPDRRRFEAERLVDELGDDPLWLFAYGSLIWKPAYDHEERLTTRVHGWRRSFCIELFRFRGSPDQPGMMLALDRGGSCLGVAYRLPRDNLVDRMDRLLDREVPLEEGLRSIRWVNARSGERTVRALCFYCMNGDEYMYRALPFEEQVFRVARACGHGGSCAEYLHNTVSHLEDMGIRDGYLWKMQHHVAEEIRAMFSG